MTWLIYPRPHGRGPIEALPVTSMLPILFTYPRPHGRGPIEATNARTLRARTSAIRDLTVAAPLKLDY